MGRPCSKGEGGNCIVAKNKNKKYKFRGMGQVVGNIK